MQLLFVSAAGGGGGGVESPAGRGGTTEVASRGKRRQGIGESQKTRGGTRTVP